MSKKFLDAVTRLSQFAPTMRVNEKKACKAFAKLVEHDRLYVNIKSALAEYYLATVPDEMMSLEDFLESLMTNRAI